MDNEKNIILIVLAGTLVILLLILTIITFVVTYNKKMLQKSSAHNLLIKNKELELLKSIIETQESEREKIASNLHDEVGPLLSRLKLNITSHKRALQKNQLEVEKLEQESKFIDTIYDNVRTVSHDLSPSFLLKFGLVKAIRNFTSNFDTPKIEVVSEINDEELISNQIIINVYRVLLELVNNTVKHDNSKTLEIKILSNNDLLIVTFNHDGIGITNDDFNKLADQSNGLGLNSIQSRIIILNAKLDFRTENDKPKIELVVPLNRK